MKYDIIIGLEIHAELKTKSKMFCECRVNTENGIKPNINTCPICLGHPGTLPLPNKQAIEWTILTGLALNCKVNELSKFDRKNYFYPDLPKGYQISQYDLPLVYAGHLKIDGSQIAITRIHLEEDTGKSTHPAGKNYSLIDYNRAGTPLMEMVTEPTIKSAEVAKKFCQNYQQILRYLDISNADMEKGEMRCEANVSVQEKGMWEYKGQCEILPLGDYKLYPKVEVKNINSFKAIEKAINYEIKRQIEAIETGEKLLQETRGWDENKQKTISQRIKETSADYRYFPEPDTPPLHLDTVWIEEIKSRLMELPLEKKERFINEYELGEEDADILVGDKYLANYTEQVLSELYAWINACGENWERQKKKLAKTVANWLISELFKYLKEDNLTIRNIKISPENFAELVTLIFQGKINSSAGQTILERMYQDNTSPISLMAELGLAQMDNNEEMEKIIKNILEKNPKQLEEFINGKEALLQYFVGQVMAATKGKANPQKTAEIIKKQVMPEGH